VFVKQIIQNLVDLVILGVHFLRFLSGFKYFTSVNLPLIIILPALAESAEYRILRNWLALFDYFVYFFCVSWHENHFRKSVCLRTSDTKKPRIHNNGTQTLSEQSYRTGTALSAEF